MSRRDSRRADLARPDIAARERLRRLFVYGDNGSYQYEAACLGTSADVTQERGIPAPFRTYPSEVEARLDHEVFRRLDGRGEQRLMTPV